MLDPAGSVYAYGYDAGKDLRNLLTVTFPDGKVRTYVYNEPVLASTSGTFSRPNHLTGISDENTTRFANFGYDNAGMVRLTEHVGGVNSYTALNTGTATATVTDPLGTSRTYTFSTILGVNKRIGLTQPNTPATSTAYDVNGNGSSRTDYNGNVTCSAFDTVRNLETKRVDGAASTAACTTALGATTLTAPVRRTTTEWNTNWRSARRMAEPRRRTTYTFFGDAGTTSCAPAGASTALICKKTVQQTNDATGASAFTSTLQGTARTWQWSYDQYGRVLSATDPRNNVTTNAYYLNDATQGAKRGMLNTVTNAAGHVTTINDYNNRGQPLSVTDANALTTTMTYLPRGWLKDRTVGAEITRYDYDGVGQMIKLTMPDSSVINYGYDGAHRLIQISDGADINSGNRIVYTLDNMGNRINEYAYDPVGVLARKSKREVDALNRLWKTYTGADASSFGNATANTYDANGNLKTTTDPLSRITTQNYDALNRLTEVIDPFNISPKTTKYEYDAQDNLTKVTDARNTAALATSYTYNGFNEVLTQTSADSGATTFTYDVAGNIATKKDPRFTTLINYTNDVLNRVSAITYPLYQTDPAETVTYTYDTCTNGKGRLCSIGDKTGTTAYSYDLNGRMTGKTQTVGGVARSVTNTYNNVTGQLTKMTLPSGAAINYTYAANGRINTMTTDYVGALSAKPIATAIDYEPFGPVGEWAWGNHDPINFPNKYTRYFDLDGRIGKIEPSATTIVDPTQYSFNTVATIDSVIRLIGTTLDNSRSISYTYDALDRLKTQAPNIANTTAATLSFTLNEIGNRISSDTGGVTTPSRRNQTIVIAYGGNNRPISYTAGTASNIVTTLVGINALGQRVRKNTGALITDFVYDESGQLIGEYDSVGNNTEHVWLSGMPIAVIRNKAPTAAYDLYYVHPDHLGTPRAVTTGYGTLWTWDNNHPFGDNAPNERANPYATVPFKYNLRFPGQYYDQETGLSYNYFRDYDPSTGRYVQSDPIGLRAGLNTYGYVKGKPLSSKDPFGLLTVGPSCSAEQRKSIEDAEREVQKKLDGSCMSCGGPEGCIPCAFVEPLRRALQVAQVTCSAGTVCGQGEVGGDKIWMQPLAFNINRCGCVSLTLLHELLHNIGLGGNDHPMISDIEKKCFPSCSVARQ